MAKKYSALIVDDERLARTELAKMLEEFDRITVCGEAEDVPSAIKAIQNLKPDVLFLDIQMPGKSGFDLLDEYDVNAKIIFVTAFDEYAIRAFEVSALDYLLKPISPERLAKAIEKLDEQGMSSNQRKLNYDDRMFLTLDSHLKFLKIRTIKSITAAGDYTEILLDDGSRKLTLKSMKEWESRLPDNCFTRIHRSTIINLEYVDKLEEWFNYSYQVYLKDVTTPYLLSRRYVAKLKARLG